MGWLRPLYTISAALVLAATPSQRVQAQQGCSATSCRYLGTVLEAGVNDDFAQPQDPADPRAPFLAWSIGQGAAVTGFDGESIDDWFIHSITGLPGHICAATLTIRLKPLGSSNNDGIAFQFDENTNAFAYSEVIQTLAGVPWNAPQPAVNLVLDLGCLPPDGLDRTSVLNEMNAAGYLDIRVQDDTAVDYISLEICSDCLDPVEASSWGGIKARYSGTE